MDITYYLTYDLPVPYKSLKIYPVTVKDYGLFNAYSACLTVNKNYTPDVKIITMNNLEYLFYVASSASKDNSETPPYLIYFDRILAFCLKEDKSFGNVEKSLERYNYDEEGKPFFMIGEEKYTSDDFEEIKEIIAKQNLVELPDYSISKEVMDALEKSREYKQKQSGVKSGSLEDYLVSLSTITGWTYEYIYSLPIRKFIKSIRRLDNLIHYKIYLAASMSGMVEFKDKSFIKHWLADIEDENKYGDVSMDLDKIQGKISLEDAQKQENSKYT